MERIIEIKGLSLRAFIGVPFQERQEAQKLCFDLRLAGSLQPVTLDDDLSKTIDYAIVSERVAEITQERPRQLIETLADEIAETVLAEFPLRWIEVTVRKFILPNTDYVSVTTRRENFRAN